MTKTNRLSSAVWWEIAGFLIMLVLFAQTPPAAVAEHHDAQLPPYLLDITATKCTAEWTDIVIGPLNGPQRRFSAYRVEAQVTYRKDSEGAQHKPDGWIMVISQRDSVKKASNDCGTWSENVHKAIVKAQAEQRKKR
jgi:hypothetical protein